MGCKTVKEHYKIGHDVHIMDDTLCIGSSYIPDLLVFDFAGKLIKDGLETYNRRAEQWPWLALIKADQKTGKFAELINAPDVYSELIPVFTCHDHAVVEKQCEKESFGYPNICTDGEMMYENTHFRTAEEAKKRLLINEMYSILNLSESVARDAENLREKARRLENAFMGLTDALNLKGEFEFNLSQIKLLRERNRKNAEC